MKALRMTLMVVAIVALAGSAMAQNTVYVQGDGTGAMNGTNYGLTLDLDGTTSNAFVEDATPDNETVYRASFWFDPNSIPMGGTGERFEIFLARTSTFKNVLRLQFMSLNTQYRVRLQVLKNSNEWVDTRLLGDEGKRFIDLPGGPQQITVEVVYGNTSDSYAAVTANGITHYKVGYWSNSWSVDKVRMGGPRMTQATGGPFTGQVFFDEFESYRTLAP